MRTRFWGQAEPIRPRLDCCSLLGDDGGSGELTAVDARDRVLLGEERDAHGSRPGRRAVDDRARDVVVAAPEHVEVGARVEVVVLAVERGRIVNRGDVQPGVVEGRAGADGRVTGGRARRPEDETSEGEDRGRGRVCRNVVGELRRPRAGRPRCALGTGRPGRSAAALSARARRSCREARGWWERRTPGASRFAPAGRAGRPSASATP